MGFDGQERPLRPITPARRYAVSDTENARLKESVFPPRGKEPIYPGSVALARQWLFDRLPSKRKTLAFLWSDAVVIEKRREFEQDPNARFTFRPDPLRSMTFLTVWPRPEEIRAEEYQTPKPARRVKDGGRMASIETDERDKDPVTRTPRIPLSREQILALAVSGQIHQSDADALLKEIA